MAVHLGIGESVEVIGLGIEDTAGHLLGLGQSRAMSLLLLVEVGELLEGLLVLLGGLSAAELLDTGLVLPGLAYVGPYELLLDLHETLGLDLSRTFPAVGRGVLFVGLQKGLLLLRYFCA